MVYSYKKKTPKIKSHVILVYLVLKGCIFLLIQILIRVIDIRRLSDVVNYKGAHQRYKHVDFASFWAGNCSVLTKAAQNILLLMV